LRII